MSDDKLVPHGIQAVPESVDSEVSKQQPVQRGEPPFGHIPRATRRIPYSRRQLQVGVMVEGVVKMLLGFTSNLYEARWMIDLVNELLEEECAVRFGADSEDND